jgi:hypothetical protein
LLATDARSGTLKADLPHGGDEKAGSRPRLVHRVWSLLSFPSGKVMKVPNPLQKIGPGHMWIWIAPILIVVIIAIAAWTGASEVRIEVGSFKVVVDWP